MQAFYPCCYLSGSDLDTPSRACYASPLFALCYPVLYEFLRRLAKLSGPGGPAVGVDCRILSLALVVFHTAAFVIAIL